MLSYRRGRTTFADRLRPLAFTVWCIGWLVVGWAMLDPSPPPIDDLSDKAVHFLSFVAVSFATLGFCRSMREFALAGLLCASVGVMLELGQILVPSRAFEVGDVIANLSGTTVGMSLAGLAWLLLQRRWRYA